MVDVDEEFDEGEYLAGVALVVMALKHDFDEDTNKLAHSDSLLAVVLEVPADIHKVARSQTADELVLE